MSALLSLFWQLLRFDRSPEDMPYSPALLLLAIGADFALTLVSLLLGKPGQPQMALILPAVSIAVELAMLAALLQVKNLGNRYVQSATAIMGGDALLTAATLPLVVLALGLPAKSPLLAVFGLVEMVLVGWGLGFRAFIYHRTLNIGLLQANLLALALFMLTTLISVKLFPELLVQANAVAAEAAKSS